MYTRHMYMHMTNVYPRKWALIDSKARVVGSFQTEEELQLFYQREYHQVNFLSMANAAEIYETSEEDGLRAVPCDQSVYDYFCIRSAPPFPAKKYVWLNAFGIASFGGGEPKVDGKPVYRTIAVSPALYQHLRALVRKDGRGMGLFLSKLITEYVYEHQETVMEPARLKFRQ